MKSYKIDESHSVLTLSGNAGNAEASKTFIIKPLLPALVEIEPHTLNMNSGHKSWRAD